jgi:hypothetical protein
VHPALQSSLHVENTTSASLLETPRMTVAQHSELPDLRHVVADASVDAPLVPLDLGPLPSFEALPDLAEFAPPVAAEFVLPAPELLDDDGRARQSRRFSATWFLPLVVICACRYVCMYA